MRSSPPKYRTLWEAPGAGTLSLLAGGAALVQLREGEGACRVQLLVVMGDEPGAVGLRARKRVQHEQLRVQAIQA